MDDFVAGLNAHIELKGKQGEYTVKNFDAFGPSLVAEKDFSIGDVVVHESAFYITTEQLVESMRQATALDQISAIGDSSVSSDAEKEQLRAWVSALTLNGYSLTGSNKTGLFVIASKVAHSCAPNVATITNAAENTLTFTAVKPIAKGEVIFSSYLAGNKLVYPSRVRSDFIRRKYYFDCMCPRCHAVDDARALKCGTCDTGTVWLHPPTGVWTCGAGGPCDARGCCGTTFKGAQADDELYTDVEEQAEEQLRVFDDVGEQRDAEGQRVLMGTVESVGTLERYLPPQHWTVVFMKRVVLEGFLRTGRGLATADCERFVVDVARWARDYVAPHSPVSAACMLHTYTGLLFTLLPDVVSPAAAIGDDSKSVFAVPLRQQQGRIVLEIMRQLFPFYEIQYGADDADVRLWKQKIGL